MVKAVRRTENEEIKISTVLDMVMDIIYQISGEEVIVEYIIKADNQRMVVRINENSIS